VKHYPVLKVLASQTLQATSHINVCLLNQVIIDWEPFQTTSTQHTLIESHWNMYCVVVV